MFNVNDKIQVEPDIIAFVVLYPCSDEPFFVHLDYVLTINGLMVVRWHKGMIFQVQHVQDELDVILFAILQCISFQYSNPSAYYKWYNGSDMVYGNESPNLTRSIVCSYVQMGHMDKWMYN